MIVKIPLIFNEFYVQHHNISLNTTGMKTAIINLTVMKSNMHVCMNTSKCATGFIYDKQQICGVTPKLVQDRQGTQKQISSTSSTGETGIKLLP
jgi:hypothetical protein